MKPETIRKMSAEQRSERAEALREAARQIESCWNADSFGAARDFIFGDPSVADHLGALNPPRWMKPLCGSDPQATVSRMLQEAERYEDRDAVPSHLVVGQARER